MKHYLQFFLTENFLYQLVDLILGIGFLAILIATITAI
jgi:hypothetical protein